nr:NADH dehydrogenase subunit 6 [Muscidifurax sinesensilla]
MMKFIFMFYINLLLLMVLFSMLIISITVYSNYIHPLLLGLILLVFSMIMSIDMSIYNYTHWFSYIMFLIIVGGLMIIFMYFISLINNMKMYINWNNLIIMPVKMMMLLLLLFIMMNSMLENMFWLNNLNITKIFLTNNEMNSINYMYTLKAHPTVISMIYLFFCLTLIVKIIINKKIMLRKIN